MTHTIDVHIGMRIRQRRWSLGMTQQQVGARLNLRSQQIQKYEAGKNRISASRLWEIAAVLSVPVSYFFEGVDEHVSELESIKPQE